MNRTSLIFILDLFLQFVLLMISCCLLFLFSQESEVYGDGRLYLILVYMWYLVINFIIIVIQLLNPLLKDRSPALLLKKKMKLMIIQNIITFLPILIFCFRVYSVGNILIWFLYFGIYALCSTYLYGLVMKNSFDSKTKLNA